MKKWMSLIFVIMSMFSVNVYAQQSGGELGDLENTCAISGGTWTTSSGGNWACCWADWGCYGCVDGVCKIKCTTQRCRDANGISRPGRKFTAVEGLAPKGMKAPVVPRSRIKHKVRANQNTVQ